MSIVVMEHNAEMTVRGLILNLLNLEDENGRVKIMNDGCLHYRPSLEDEGGACLCECEECDNGECDKSKPCCR